MAIGENLLGRGWPASGRALLDVGPAVGIDECGSLTSHDAALYR